MSQAQRIHANLVEQAPESAQQRLIAACERIDRRSIESLLSLYADDIYYEDAYKALQGKNAFLDYCEDFLGDSTATIRVITSIQDSHSFFLSWSARLESGNGSGRNTGKRSRVEGASYFKTRNGLIYFQRNYFDLG